MSLLQCNNVDIIAGGRTLCHGLDLTINRGERWAVLGGNGSGKSTLLHTLTGLTPPHSGSITLNDALLDTLPRRTVAQQLALLLQESHDPFPATVWESAISGRHPHLGRWQNEGQEDTEITRHALLMMDLEGMEQRQVQSLSGGERRRLALATVLIQQTPLVLLDEPLNHLDLRHQQQLLAHTATLAAEGKGIVMVLHDPNQALRHCSRVLLLYGNGEWECGRSEELLTAERLTALYHHPMRTVDVDGERLFLPQ